MANPNDFDYLNQIVDELQEFIINSDRDTIERFCGFTLDGINKEDAVYQVMTQMPDDVLLEYYNDYVLNN